jgi:carbamoyl-phosphate synthase large subunit
LKTRILLTAAGGTLSPVTIECLKESRRHQVEVIAVDSRADAIGRLFADHFYVVPAGDAPSYVERVEDLVKRLRVDIVLPCSDEEALALASNSVVFERLGCKLACAEIETLKVFANKVSSYRLLEKLGIRVPLWRVATTLEELVDVVRAMAKECGDLALKPAASRGGRNVFIIREGSTEVSASARARREIHLDAETLFREHSDALRKHFPFLVMERLREPAYDIDVLAWRGQPLRIVPRRRLNPAGIPFTGSVMEESAALQELAESIVRTTKLSWLYDFDVMLSRQSVPMIVEMNPRPSGSVAAAVKAGVPLLDDVISLAKGEPLPSISFPSDVCVVPFVAIGVAKTTNAQAHQ